MQSTQAVRALTALAQLTRLEVFRLLVKAGPTGLPVGQIAEKVDVPGPTLSFHLKELVHADLIEARQEGRFIFYSACFDQMDDLLQFLTENCCGGDSAACSLPSPKTSRKVATVTRASTRRGRG